MTIWIWRLMDYLERACHSATANDLFRLKDDSILPERILQSKGRYGHSLFPFDLRLIKAYWYVLECQSELWKKLSNRFCWNYIRHKGRHKETVLFYPLLEFHRKVSSQYLKAIHDTCAWIQCQTFTLTIAFRGETILRGRDRQVGCSLI